ncbi:MAG: UDPGP type 1 family protein, partial [Clostridia bacterium]|nr:UDPGP type 1 family protein [Clostridia bacterium]
LNLLSEEKVGAVLLAGGQGSRLGFNGPKGTFNIGVSRKLSIFEQQMDNIKNVTSLTGRYFPLFIMTSNVNNDETVKFFEEHNFFGYPRDRIHFFIQDVAPTCDYSGKVFLDEKHRVSLAPNGNGGWYSSLINSGLGRVLERDGIEWLNVYSVDNVLQRICDPVFIGATVLMRCRCGAKVVKKACPEEKVGVLCLEDGKPAIVEYFELPDDLKYKTKKGELVYRYGVTLNYLFNVQDLNSTLNGKLPYHLAEKAIAHVEDGERITPAGPCGYKFETLVVDMVKLMGSCLAFEVEREAEFAPVKNSTGVDSVDTARELLRKNGVQL